MSTNIGIKSVILHSLTPLLYLTLQTLKFPPSAAALPVFCGCFNVHCSFGLATACRHPSRGLIPKDVLQKPYTYAVKLPKPKVDQVFFHPFHS